MAFSGTVAIRAMKDNDYVATVFPGTTAGLQAAIDYLAGGKGKVMIGPGTLAITDATTLASDLTIEGAGTVLQRDSSGLGVNVFTGTGVSNVLIRGIAFDNNSLAVTDDDLDFSTACSNVRIDGCRWINLTNRAANLVTFNTSTGAHHRYISITGNNVVGGTTTDTYNSFRVFCASDVDVSGNVIDGWGAIKIEQSSTSTVVMRRINVSRNRFLNVDQTHIFIRPAGSTEIEDIAVSDNVGSVSSMSVLKGMVNVAENTTGSGSICRNISIRGNCGRGHQGHFINIAGVNGTAENVSVVGNTFDGRYDGSSTISATSESSGINFTTTTKRISVTGNTIRYTGRSGIRGACDQGVVANNVLELTAQNDLSAPTPVREAGIYIFNTTTNCVVSGNVVYNSSNSTNNGTYVTGGIVIDNAASVTGVTITGNIVYEDRTGSEGMEYGIKVGIAGGGANPDEVFVNGNRCIGASAGPIILYGTGTQVCEGNIGANDSGLKGADVASTATVTLPIFGRFFDITGTADITSITASWPGRTVTLKFDGTAATTGLTDGSNLKLSGNLGYTPDDTITLVCDGTNWYEVARSTN